MPVEVRTPRERATRSNNAAIQVMRRIASMLRQPSTQQEGGQSIVPPHPLHPMPAPEKDPHHP